MRSDIVPGAVFPDYRALRPHRETPEALRTARTASHGSGPQPRRFLPQGPAPGGRARSNSIARSRLPIAGWSRSAPTISPRPMNIAPASAPIGHSFPTPAASCKKISISPNTPIRAQPDDSACDCAGAGLVIYKIYNGYWFLGRPTVEELRQDLRAVTKKCRPDWDITTPELKAAWQQGRKELFYPYGKTYAQTLGGTGLGPDREFRSLKRSGVPACRAVVYRRGTGFDEGR